MKRVVIDINENVFTRLFDNGIEDYEITNYDLSAIVRSIRGGIPLPKGHGDLIDINNINEITLEDSLHCISHTKGDEVEWHIDAPVIVAADKQVDRDEKEWYTAWWEDE